MTTRLLAAAAATLIAGMVSTAQASIYDNTYAVTASEGQGKGQFDTANGNPFACSFASNGMITAGANTACASFTYSGPIAFNNQAAQNGISHQGDQNSAFGFTIGSISNYNGMGTVAASDGTIVARYGDAMRFLNASGSASNFDYGTYFTFDLGVVAAGTVLTITHDDGISLFQGGSRIGTTASGPTGQVTDVVRINSSGDTILRYARENGTPSVLIQSVPEPVSLALLGTGLIGLGASRSRRRRSLRASA